MQLWKHIKGYAMTYKEWISEENLLRLEAWARDGLTEEDISKNIGISKVSLWDWKKKHPSVLNALKKGKEVADIIVENALYKRAIGYDYEEVKTITTADGEIVQRVTTKKHMPPDTTAQIFWLKNRKVEVWRDKVELEGDTETKQQLSEICSAMSNIRKNK